MTGQAKTRSSRATIAKVVALLVWVGVIWGNSLTPGTESSEMSDLVAAFVRPFLEVLGVTETSAQTFLVRKAAHFSEYLALAVLASSAMRALRAAHGARRGWMPLAAAVCVAVPCIDETIQTFVPGRVGAVGDVLIDLCGCAAGLALFVLVTCRAT